MYARQSTFQVIRDGVALALFVALVGTLCAILATGQMARADAVTRAATPAQQAQRACAAFSAWERRGTRADMGRLVVASLPLGRSWLAADIGQLYADASSPSVKAAGYAASDREHVSEDCSKL